MGNVFGKIFDRFFGNKEYRIIMIGLDNAGKTTILYKLKLGRIENTIPTIGFNVEMVQYKKIFFNVFDVGGQDKIRPLWRHYYDNNDGIIFVIDSTDSERLDKNELKNSAKDEINKLLENPQLSNAPLLIFANKQDLPDAIPVREIANRLELYKSNHKWFIQGTNALTGDGLHAGLEWLSQAIAAATKK